MIRLEDYRAAMPLLWHVRDRFESSCRLDC